MLQIQWQEQILFWTTGTTSHLLYSNYFTLASVVTYINVDKPFLQFRLFFSKGPLPNEKIFKIESEISKVSLVVHYYYYYYQFTSVLTHEIKQSKIPSALKFGIFIIFIEEMNSLSYKTDREKQTETITHQVKWLRYNNIKLNV